MTYKDDPVLADDGYPSTVELERIRTWEIHNGEDFKELMKYVHARWYMPEWGWSAAKRLRVRFPGAKYASEGDRRRSLRRIYHISTAGWSGNESIIGALEGNMTFWMVCWEQSRVGGHYIFGVPEHFD